MKKILLFLAATFSLLAANCQVIFSEDFDGISGPTAGGAGTYTFPAGWFLRNVDNRTPNAQTSYVNEAWERREDFNFSVIDSVAFSTSYYSPVGAADDWMWTPLIGPITGQTFLKWNAVAYDPAFRDGYEVRIMAAPTSPTGGTGVMGNQVTNSTVVFSTAAENSSWTAHQVPLAAYAGQSIYVGFRNNSNDKFLLLIDDVVVENIVDHDIAVSNVSHGEYTLAPVQQQTTAVNFELEGTLTSLGLSAATNVALACDVIVDGSLLTTVQSTPIPSLAAGASSTVTIPYTPTVEGSYQFKFYPIANEAEENTGNDTIFDPIGIVIDPTMMHRHYGPATGTLGIGGGQVGYLGQTYRFETAVNIEAVETYFTRGYATKNLCAVIYATNASGVPTTLIAATDTLVYQDDSARVYTMPVYGGTITLPAGEYAFLQVEFDSTLAVGNTASIYTPGSIYVKYPAAGPNFVPVENYPSTFWKPLMIYPKFDMCFGETGGTLGVITQASCGLSDGTTTLAMDPGYAVLWEDSTTAATNAALPAGWHTFTVSNAYCSFTDSVEITNPDAPVAVIDTIENALCFGGDGTITLDIQGVAAPYMVTWSDGSTDGAFTGPAGTYSATIVDTNNCSATVANATIGEPAQIMVAIGQDPAICFGQEGMLLLDIEGGMTPYSVLWSDGSTGNTLTAVAGTYSVTVTDTNDCFVTIPNAVITEPAELTATVSGTDETCGNCDDGTVSVTTTGGTAPYSILWNNGDNGSTITDLEPGMYAATITDANGCTFETDSVFVEPYVVGITELDKYGITVFPNPVADYLTITAKNNNVTSITLIDASGKLITGLTESNDTFTVDMRGLAKGTYQLIIRTNTGTVVSAVSKQ